MSRTLVALASMLGVLVAAGTSLLTYAEVTNGSAASEAPKAVLAPPPGYSANQLIFSDNFPGTSLDKAKWTPSISSRGSNGIPWNTNGKGGSGPEQAGDINDIEYDIPNQVHVSNGLSIRANAAPTPGRLGTAYQLYPWRSGVISTYHTFQFTGGYVQIEAKMPAAPGMWPALWMLPGPGGTGGDNFEIDIFEGGYLGNGANPVRNYAWHIHAPRRVLGGVVKVAPNLTTGYHVYGLAWVPGKSLTWYLDGSVIASVTSAEVSIPTEPMELILDLQVASAMTKRFHTLPGPLTPSSNLMSVRDVQVYG